MTILIIHLSIIFLFIRCIYKIKKSWSFIYTLLYLLSLEFLFWVNFYFESLYLLIYWDLKFLIFFLVLFFFFFLLKILSSIIFIYENYTIKWWEDFLSHLWMYSIGKILKKNKVIKINYLKFWVSKQNKFNFIYFYLNFFNFLYFFLIFYIFLYFFFFSFSIDFIYLFINFKIYLFIYIYKIIIIKLYLLIFSSIFISNLLYLKIYNLKNFFFIWNYGFIDLYLHTHTFIDGLTISLKKYKIFEFPLSISLNLFGYKIFKKKKKYWYTLTIYKTYKRYSLPFLWITYENILVDELMNTFFFKWKNKFKIYFYYYINLKIKNEYIIFSPFYENNLKNSFI